MALTKSRTRTQTALTKLATTIGNIKGELEFLEGLIASAQGSANAIGHLLARKHKLQAQLGALVIALHQFDARFDSEAIRGCEDWRKAIGRASLKPATFERKYLAQLERCSFRG